MFKTIKMNTERDRFHSCVETPTSMSSRSDSLNSVVISERGGTFSGRISNSGCSKRNKHKNKRTNIGSNSSDYGLHRENTYTEHREFRDNNSRGQVSFRDNTRDHGKVSDNNRRFHGQQQNKVRQNGNSSITGNMHQNYNVECKYYLCPVCKLPYNYFKNRNPLSGRLPRILECGHTMCEDCINKSLKITNHICCSICLEETKNETQQNFDYNHFIVGHITCSKMNQNFPVDFTDVSLMSTAVKLQGSRSDKLIDKIFENCGLGGCSTPGTIRCLDCCEVYCKKCDEALHNSVKYLLSHKRNDIKKVSYELKKCPDHSMLEELYCVNCEENCCCYCMLEKHEGHNKPAYLVRLNEAEEEELKNSYKIAGKKLQELLQSKKEIEKSHIDEVSDVEIEIAQCFTDIHAKLYLIEKKLREEVSKKSNKSSTLIENNDIISSNIETLKYLMMCVDRRSEMKLNLRGVLLKLKEMEKTPSVMVFDESDKTEARLVVDEKVKQLETYFKLEIPTIKSYRLVTADELPENDKNEEVLQLKENNVKNLANRTSPQNEASTSRSKAVKPAKLKRGPKNEFEQQTVYVTHMHSLNSFYVQFKKEDEQFRELMQEIKSHVEKDSTEVAEVDINKLYLTACLTNKNEWGRIRVLEEVVMGSDIKYKVKFIDFGNEKVVDKRELKYISSNLANRRPFAVECKLDNLSQIPWTKNSHLQLANILGVNKEVIMFTKEFSNNIYTVDLNIVTSCGDLSSVSDLLVFGCGALQTNSKPPEIIFPDSKQIFDNSETFEKGESYAVYLRYVLDPWNIYIQKASYEKSLSSLISSMETFYHSSKCDIHLPIKGSDVVIFYHNKDYGNWHRARILEVFSDIKVVKVFLVDWGKCVKAPWVDLRNLVELFRKTECLVVHVKLADVGPKYGNDWSHLNSSDARKFLEKYSIKNKPLKMLISETIPLEIVLFEEQQTYDNNINALLVKQGFACSTGKLSETIKWLHKNNEDEKVDESEYLHIYKNLTDDDDSDEDLQGIKSQVEIIRFDNPHSIYVSFLLMEAESKRLHEELQIHYKENYDVQESWNVTDKVVVFNPPEKMYYRGIIQMIEHELYYIYLLDRGHQICVTERELRHISTYFSSNFPNMVLKCHLANIKPAGDINKWSSLSIEWFQKLFEKQKEIYIKKVLDDKTRSSMPVTMWYCKIQQGTALEPSVRKFISVDKQVVKAGLAFHVIKGETQKKTHKSIKLEPGEFSGIIEKSDYMAEKEDPNIVHYSGNSLEEPITSMELMKPEIEKIYDKNIQIKEWLPPISIEKQEFNAYITCAETEGYLFVRDEELQPLYKEMESNIKKHFDSIPKVKNFVLYENQLVTIWSQNCWYRGVILSVIDKTTAKVMMVDFGSDHIVKIDHLHNKIMYPEIPIMVSKIKLYDVHSKTAMWSESDVDNLLNTVSEYSRIVIRGCLNDGIPLADVYDDEGICLNDKMVKLCPNLYRNNVNEGKNGNSHSSSDHEQDNMETPERTLDGNSSSQSVSWNSIIEEERENMCRKIKDFNYVNLPNVMSGEKVLMDITSVLDYRTVSLYVGNDESRQEEFELLSKSLQEEAPYLESLRYCEIGMPCISLFEEDKKWYRAKVIQIDQRHCGYVTVLYVDYGNFEIVKVCDLKPVNPEWLNFPATFFVAELNYHVGEIKNECYLLKHLQELAGTSKFVEIVKHQPLSIHIYENDKLYYDLFVINGVIQLDEEDTV